MSNRWNDKHFIYNIKGSLEEFPLFLVLLSAASQKIDCVISINTRQAKRNLTLRNGSIVGSKGFLNLLKSLDISSIPGSAMGDLMGLAISKGHRPDVVLDAMATGLAAELLGIGLKGDISVSEYVKPSIPIKLSKSIPNLLLQGSNSEATESMLDREYTGLLSHSIVSKLPEGLHAKELGLPPKAARMLLSISTDTLVHQLLGDTSSITDKWRQLHFLYRLGLITTMKPDNATAYSDEENPHQSSSNAKSSTHDKLLEAFTRLESLEPHEILQITTAKEVNEVTIDKNYRKLSSEFHPDRFHQESIAVQELSQRIFELFTEVTATLKEEKYRVALKTRLDAEERGEKYVSEEDRKQSSLIYEQARFLFQRKRYQDAGDLLQKCIDMNPEPWRFHYMHIQTKYHTKTMNPNDAGTAILAIQGLSGHQRLEVMIKGSEYLLESTSAESHQTALGIIKQVLDIQPDHKTALRLKSKHNRKQESSTKKKKEVNKDGFFKSLFKKK